MWQTTTIRTENGTWLLRIQSPAGAPQEFTCATEAMARRLESVFARGGRQPTRAR